MDWELLKFLIGIQISGIQIQNSLDAVGKFMKVVVSPFNFPEVTKWGSALVKFKSILLSSHDKASPNNISIYCKYESITVVTLFLPILSNAIKVSPSPNLQDSIPKLKLTRSRLRVRFQSTLPVLAH